MSPNFTTELPINPYTHIYTPWIHFEITKTFPVNTINLNFLYTLKQETHYLQISTQDLIKHISCRLPPCISYLTDRGGYQSSLTLSVSLNKCLSLSLSLSYTCQGFLCCFCILGLTVAVSYWHFVAPGNCWNTPVVGGMWDHLLQILITSDRFYSTNTSLYEMENEHGKNCEAA